MALLASGVSVGRSQTPAEVSPMVGGAPMYSTKTIVENASESRDHTTLVAAVKAAGLVDTARPIFLSRDS